MLVVAEHVVATELVDADEPLVVSVDGGGLGPAERVPEKEAFAEVAGAGVVAQEAWAVSQL